MLMDVESRILRKNKILFSHDSKCLEKLSAMLENSSRKTAIMWALEMANLSAEVFESKYPHEHRPSECIRKSLSWARGEIKMQEAKRAILECHSVSKELENDPPYSALCHGIAQAASTVHVKSHAMGLPFYELTYIVLNNDKKNYEDSVIEKIKFYEDRLAFWNETINTLDLPWASFL